MAIFKDDEILAVLAGCDITTVIKCRVVSRHFQRLIDNELALDKAEFSDLTFRQRRSITDSIIAPRFAHLFSRASIVNLDGTGIGHNGAVKFATDYTKELHVERWCRIDLAKLIHAIAGQRWLSWELAPVRLYVKDQTTSGTYKPCH